MHFWKRVCITVIRHTKVRLCRVGGLRKTYVYLRRGQKKIDRVRVLGFQQTRDENRDHINVIHIRVCVTSHGACYMDHACTLAWSTLIFLTSHGKVDVNNVEANWRSVQSNLDNVYPSMSCLVNPYNH